MHINSVTRIQKTKTASVTVSLLGILHFVLHVLFSYSYCVYIVVKLLCFISNMKAFKTDDRVWQSCLALILRAVPLPRGGTCEGNVLMLLLPSQAPEPPDAGGQHVRCHRQESVLRQTALTYPYLLRSLV